MNKAKSNKKYFFKVVPLPDGCFDVSVGNSDIHIKPFRGKYKMSISKNGEQIQSRIMSKLDDALRSLWDIQLWEKT